MAQQYLQNKINLNPLKIFIILLLFANVNKLNDNVFAFGANDIADKK